MKPPKEALIDKLVEMTRQIDSMVEMIGQYHTAQEFLGDKFKKEFDKEYSKLNETRKEMKQIAKHLRRGD